MPKSPLGTPLPRKIEHWLFACYAPETLFGPWENVHQALQDDCVANGGLPCEGSGDPGPWCDDCRFGESDYD